MSPEPTSEPLAIVFFIFAFVLKDLKLRRSLFSKKQYLKKNSPYIQANMVKLLTFEAYLATLEN
jgi:hypothetical protein